MAVQVHRCLLAAPQSCSTTRLPRLGSSKFVTNVSFQLKFEVPRGTGRCQRYLVECDIQHLRKERLETTILYKIMYVVRFSDATLQVEANHSLDGTKLQCAGGIFHDAVSGKTAWSRTLVYSSSVFSSSTAPDRVGIEYVVA